MLDKLKQKLILSRAAVKAQEYRKAESWAELDALIDSLQQRFGDILPIQLMRCRADLWVGRFEHAANEARSILSGQSHTLARELLVQAYLGLGELSCVELELPKLVDAALAGKIPARKVGELCSRLGRELYQKWELERAKKWAIQALALDDDVASAHLVLSHVYESSGDQVAALKSARAALKVDPLMPEAARKVFFLGGRGEPQLNLSVADIVETIRSVKNSEQMLIRCVQFLINVDRVSDVRAVYRLLRNSAFLSESGKERFSLSVARALILDQAFDEALELLSQLSSVSQTSAEKVKLLKSQCYFETGRFKQSIELVRQVSNQAEGFNLVRFNALLGCGYIGEAFELYRRSPLPKSMQEVFKDFYHPHMVPHNWQNTSMILLANAGIGDEIRWASIYKELPSGWIITCDPRIEPLLSRSFPDLIFLPVHRNRLGVRNSLSYLTHSMVGAQPLAMVINNSVVEKVQSVGAVGLVQDRLSELRSKRSDFPKHSGYLLAKDELVNHWRKIVDEECDGGRLHVALSWRSMLESALRDQHYLSVEDLMPLGDLQKTTFWIVQPSVKDFEIDALRRSLPDVRVVLGLDLNNDFEGMAAFLENVDAVISPCTTTAELGGALGVRTYLFGRSEQLRWRRNEDGSDIWHSSVEVVLHPGGNEMRNPLVQGLLENLKLLELQRTS